MRPYYEHAGITIYHGDCREVLPRLPKFNLLLTDPPYGIGESSKNHSSRGTVAPGREYGCDSWDDAVCEDGVQAGILAAQWAVIFGGNFYQLPPSPCWLVWDKVNGASDFADCELAWTNRKSAVRLFRWQWRGMIQQQQDKRRTEKRVHPTQKPLALMKWCISLFPDVKTILDPFMGSGTTLVAAKNLGRSAIGIEINERYCEIAAKRLAQEVLDFG